MQPERQDEFKVAPIISDQKWEDLKYRVVETIIGYNKQNTPLLFSIILYVAFPAICFIIPLVASNYIASIVVPTGIIICIVVLTEIVNKGREIILIQIIIKILILGTYLFLWANHIYYLNHIYYDAGLLVLSAVSILTSLSTISLLPVKEFSANSVEYLQLGLSSTMYMRFFIVFPTLLAQFIIDNANSDNHVNSHLYPLRVFNSLIFITWWLGWITSLKSTIFFILDKINILVFGDESKIAMHYTLISILVNMISITIYEIIYYRNGTISLNPFIIGMTISSILSFVRYNKSIKDMMVASITRVIASCILQIIICTILACIYSKVDLTNVNVTIFLAIDIVLYTFFNIIKEMLRGWSRIGVNINCTWIKYTHLLGIERFILRAISGFCVLLILVQYIPMFSSIFGYQQNIIAYAITPFLAFRSFKRTLSQSKSFSLHFSMLLALILIHSNFGSSSCLAILFMPSFPPNFYLAIFSVFQIPPKAKHKNEFCYQIGYFLLSIIGLSIHLLTLGIFELTMIFGLPIYFPIIPTITQGYQVKSAQNTLYQKIIQNIDPSLFRFYDLGLYLLRIEKYIILLEVKAQCYGFCEIIDFIGLEVQEVTSCHSKEGQTIDRLVEQTWRENNNLCNCAPYFATISPLLKDSLYISMQNDIQLTGVIETKQFVQLFKDTALKAFVRQYSRLTLNENQKKQGEIIMGEMSAFYKKEAAEKLFPAEFAKKCNVLAAYPSSLGKAKKLPPISKKGVAKNEVLNDFLDLLDNSEQQAPETSMDTFKQKQSGLSNPNQSEVKKIKIQELNMAIILTMYYYTVAKQDYINTEKLCRLIKAEADVVSQIDFDHFPKICSLALGSAFKISIDKYINGDFTVDREDFEAYDSTSFLGTSDSENFKNAMMADKQDIWTVSYIKKALTIKRLAKAEASVYIFKADQAISKSVWNNLRFQLLYATNDNDERYSIQTHPTLLRNLWVEACEQPFGYPSYNSGLLMNK